MLTLAVTMSSRKKSAHGHASVAMPPLFLSMLPRMTVAQDDVLRDAFSKCCKCYVAVAGRKCWGGFV